MSVVNRVRIWPRNAATGAVVPVFLAGGSNDRPYHDGQNHYRAGLIADPRFEASVSFTDAAWGARAIPQVGAIGWMPANAAQLDEMAALYWRDAAIEIDRVVGNVVQRRLTGTVAEASVNSDRLVITCADLGKGLDKAVSTATFSGKGGIEGGDYAIGRAKRRSFGVVWDIEGRLLDKANNIYEFGDPAFPLQGCIALRDKGRAGPLGILGWQGSIDATLNALRASQPQQGGGVFAPSIACAKWFTQPVGPLAADLQGEAAGYSVTAAGIAAQLLALAGGPAIGNAGPNRPAPMGIHIGDNSETTAAALDRLLQKVGMGWRATLAGTIELWEYGFASIETLQATFISRETTLQPVKSFQVGYRKNERIHGDGEISAALLASDVIYNDGTTAEDWKPAEPGADKTSNNTAANTKMVADRVAEALVKQADVSTETALDQGLRLEDYLRIVQAWSFVEGQPVSSQFAEFRNTVRTDVSALESFARLLGAKNQDGTAVNLSLDTVYAGPDKTMAQHIQDLSANTARVKFLLEALTGPNGDEARGLLRVDAHDRFAAIVLASGREISQMGLIADKTVIAKEDGTVMAAFGVDPADPTLAYIERLRVGYIAVGAMNPEFNAKKTITASQITQEFPGGLIMKTGSYKSLIGDETAMSIVFETPFPTECRSFTPVPRINAPSNFRDLWIQIVGDPTRFGATIQTQSSTSNNNNIDGLHWTAWGF